MKTIRFCSCVLLILCAALAAAAEVPRIHIRNFAQVDEHIYRGGAPSELGLEDLHKLHISIDLDLREPGASGAIERAEAERLGMKYIEIPMRPFSRPTPDEVKQALQILLSAEADTDRVFVHCRRGSDRTGTVIACYRIQHDAWSNRRALEEARRYGISFAERGMRSYILRFRPIALPTIVTASTQPRLEGAVTAPAESH